MIPYAMTIQSDSNLALFQLFLGFISHYHTHRTCNQQQVHMLSVEMESLNRKKSNGFKFHGDIRKDE